MKLYHMREDGKMCTADVADDAMLLEYDATFGPRGVELPPIEQINRQDGWFQRRGGEREPIPPSAVRLRDLDLRLMTAEEIAAEESRP